MQVNKLLKNTYDVGYVAGRQGGWKWQTPYQHTIYGLFESQGGLLKWIRFAMFLYQYLFYSFSLI